ncbi:SH3 domain-containing protein [Marinobacter sp. LQ44]|uniref:SH3 domain-containing protein n=1 Tax=unclassified Marinobacter TaxID=83889 RepID=UPI0009ECD323|nr:SH3 domain-containing protein [Marinobacter sp. LQ44]
MDRLVFTFLISALLAGCAQTYTWTKPGASSSDFYRSSSYCEALSTGATPIDYSSNGSSTSYHSGSVTDNSGNTGYYSGTTTTYQNNTGQAMGNAVKAIRRQGIYNDCMRGKGWVPENEGSVYASMSQNVQADQANVFLRAEPSFGAEKLADASGQFLEVIEESDQWIRVRMGDKEGFVHRSKIQGH